MVRSATVPASRTTPADGLVYDASTVSQLLRLRRPECHEPVPRHDGENIVVFYGGWSLQELCPPPIKANGGSLWYQEQYRDRGWTAELGYYRVLPRVPGTRGKTFPEQLAILSQFGFDWEPVPVCLLMVLLAVHLLATRDDLLHGDCSRCAEALTHSLRTSCHVYERRPYILCDGDTDRHSQLWLAAALKC